MIASALSTPAASQRGEKFTLRYAVSPSTTPARPSTSAYTQAAAPHWSGMPNEIGSGGKYTSLSLNERPSTNHIFPSTAALKMRLRISKAADDGTMWFV